jgi:hypothetical protein
MKTETDNPSFAEAHLVEAVDALQVLLLDLLLHSQMVSFAVLAGRVAFRHLKLVNRYMKISVTRNDVKI